MKLLGLGLEDDRSTQAEGLGTRDTKVEDGPVPVLQTAEDAEGPLKTVAVKKFKVVSFMLGS